MKNKKKRSVFPSKVRAKPSDEPVDAASLKTRIRYLALFVITLVVYESESDIVFLSLISFCLLCMENIRRNDCAWTWMFALREIKTFSQSSAYIRDIFTKLHRENAFVFEQLSRAATQTKIFSIRICPKKCKTIFACNVQRYSAIFLLNFHYIFICIY